MCEQQYRKAAEYFWNNILRHPNWSDKEWEYYKSVHESNGYSIARTAWYIGEAVINNEYTIVQLLDKLKKIRHTSQKITLLPDVTIKTKP